MRSVWSLLCILFTIVIIDPYADIKYGEVDVYEYEDTSEKQPKKKRRARKRDSYKKKKRIWCWMCNPPRWLYRK